MLTVRCKECNTELISSSRTQVCGCPNMMTITGDAVSATNLNKVVITRLDNVDRRVLLLKIFNGKRTEESVKLGSWTLKLDK